MMEESLWQLQQQQQQQQQQQLCGAECWTLLLVNVDSSLADYCGSTGLSCAAGAAPML